MLLFATLLLGCPTGFGNDDTGAELPPLDPARSVDDLLQTLFLELKPSRSEEYTPPDDGEIELFRTAMTGLAADGNLDRTPFLHAGYDLTRIDGDSRTVYVVREIQSRGRAAVLFDPEATRGLIIEAPHTGFETDIWAQSGAVFQTLGARALIVNTAHRCTNEAPSGCDGTSSACGDPDWYRVSDAAHNADSNFQVAHEALADSLPADIVVSMHGFGWDGSEPVAFVSDGTEKIDDNSIGARFSGLLTERFPEGFTSASCNATADLGVARLCGTTNTQGRHLNGSFDSCNTAATTASGRFVHLEQALDLRRPDGDIHRGDVIDALRELTD